MNPTPAIARSPQPILSRLLEKRLDSPAGTDKSVHTTSLLSALLEDAQRERASDVHLDPDSGVYQVRLRIDGAVIDTIRLSSVDGVRVVRACKDPGQS